MEIYVVVLEIKIMGEKGHVAKFLKSPLISSLSKTNNKIYKSPISKKFELNKQGKKAFPALFKSERAGRIGFPCGKAPRPLLSLSPGSFQIKSPLHLTFTRTNEYSHRFPYLSRKNFLPHTLRILRAQIIRARGKFTVVALYDLKLRIPKAPYSIMDMPKWGNLPCRAG